jgi:ketosteroid isomerase-like protein
MSDTTVHGLAHRTDTTDLISRYAHAVDRGDASATVECFTADALVQYEGGQIRLEGHEEPMRFYADTLTSPSTHLISNTLVELSGDEARTLSSALACVTRGFVTVRGLTYETRCLRRDESWQIAHLLHAAKFGVVGMARALAMRYGKENIRFNTICPGAIDTPMLREFQQRPDAPSSADDVEEVIAKFGSMNPMGRNGQPHESAAAALFLVSDDASYATLTVDGGMTA